MHQSRHPSDETSNLRAIYHHLVPSGTANGVFLFRMSSAAAQAELSNRCDIQSHRAVVSHSRGHLYPGEMSPGVWTEPVFNTGLLPWPPGAPPIPRREAMMLHKLGRIGFPGVFALLGTFATHLDLRGLDLRAQLHSSQVRPAACKARGV